MWAAYLGEVLLVTFADHFDVLLHLGTNVIRWQCIQESVEDNATATREKGTARQVIVGRNRSEHTLAVAGRIAFVERVD